MTYNDLCTEIIALGFETELDSPERILTAVRRAMQTIFTERPLYGTLTLYQRPITPIIRLDGFSHKGGDTERVSYTARAYFFKTAGIGSCKISDSSGERILNFSGNGISHRGFLYGEGYLEFCGEFSYSVYDLAIYDEICDANPEAIPEYSGYTEYTIASYTEDFLSFAFPPTDAGGVAIQGAVLKDGKIKIPNSFTGKISLVYKRAPIKTDGNPDDELILPDGCEHLLALLVAAYVWLDDDSEKAQYYMNLYREAMAAVKYYDRPYVDNRYHDVIGWA